MRKSIRSLAVLMLFVALAVSALASAYNAKPKLVVVIVIDQFRGDMLERHYDELSPNGFRTLLDHGAWFKNCYYNYANTETGPGHATIGTGSYTLGHGIMANQWYDPARGRFVTSVQDDNAKVLGADVAGPSASPHNLQTDTIGDELKLATGGRAKVFGISLKDRAAVLPVGYSANAAYWIDYQSGAWITSTYYMTDAPAWVTAFNEAGSRAKYLGREWKASDGKVLRSTAQEDGKPKPFFELVGPTPFANDYTIDFARALIENEKLGQGPVTDLLSISFSSNDILGHKVGPDSVEEREMVLSLDRQIGGFLQYLKAKFGADNLIVALTADHGVAPLPDYAKKLRIPASNLNIRDYAPQLNEMLASKLGKEGKYVVSFDYPKAFLNPNAFAAAGVGEAEAERTVGDMMMQFGIRGYVTKSQLAANEVPDTVFSQQLRNSYSPLPSWYVFGFASPFVIASTSGTSHGQPYSYDAHVPLVLYGNPFKAGSYYQHAEPVDLAVTLSAVLGINKPASAVGRPLWEAISVEQPKPAARAAVR